MVWDQGPGIAGRFALHQDIRQALQKIIPVGISQEDLSPSNPSRNDMVQSTRGIYP